VHPCDLLVHGGRKHMRRVESPTVFRASEFQLQDPRFARRWRRRTALAGTSYGSSPRPPLPPPGAVFNRVINAIKDRRPVLIVLVQPPPVNQISITEFAGILDAGRQPERVPSVGRGASDTKVFRRR
jgi:hypothetical protein